MKNETEFLSIYKDYETAIRANGTEPMTIEQNAPPELSESLKMCRLFRNYLSHNNNPNFIVPTDKMIVFMKQQLNDAQLASPSAVKKHIKRPAASICMSTDLCTDALDKLKVLKADKLVIFDVKAANYFFASIHDIATLAVQSKKAKLSVIKPLKDKIGIHMPTDDIKTVDRDKLNICTSDGTVTGKLIGLITFK